MGLEKKMEKIKVSLRGSDCWGRGIEKKGDNLTVSKEKKTQKEGVGHRGSKRSGLGKKKRTGVLQ